MSPRYILNCFAFLTLILIASSILTRADANTLDVVNEDPQRSNQTVGAIFDRIRSNGLKQTQSDLLAKKDQMPSGGTTETTVTEDEDGAKSAQEDDDDDDETEEEADESEAEPDEDARNEAEDNVYTTPKPPTTRTWTDMFGNELKVENNRTTIVIQNKARDLGFLAIKAFILGPLIGLTIKAALIRGLLWAIGAWFLHLFFPTLLSSLGLGTGLVGFARQMQPDFARMILPHLANLTMCAIDRSQVAEL